MKNNLEKKAKSLVLRMLMLRQRSRHELEQYLERKGFLRESTCSVLDTLEEYGYINDTEFTRWWVNKRLGKRGLRGLRQELRMKGICTGTIDEIFNELECDAEYNCAVRLAEKEIGRRDRADNYLRLLRLLNRRGYTCEVINKIRFEKMGDS